MLDVSPYSELELSPMELGDEHNRIQINSETELHRDCFALYRQIDQRYNNIDGGSLMNLSTRKKTVQVQ